MTSFLISTPESGADSIAITYALLDPIMTVVRPLAAFLTAFTAGIAVNRAEPDAPGVSTGLPGEGAPEGSSSTRVASQTPKAVWGVTAKRVFQELRFAFTDFWGDIAPAFFVGVLLAGLISALIPARFLTEYLGGGPIAMLIMLAAGIPLYICASASTPIAAALILKGVSPGAALVFLLAGPATNAAALAVVLRTMGRRTTVIYLLSIAGCALLFGLLVDALYTAAGLSAVAVAGKAAEAIPAGLALAAAVGLLVITFYGFWRKYAREAQTGKVHSSDQTAGLAILPHPRAGQPSEGPT